MRTESEHLSTTTPDRQRESVPSGSAAPETPQLRRNFVLGVLHGWFLAGGLAFADPYTVLPVFLRELTASNWVVGLAAPLIRGGGFLPQILTARYAETLSRQKPLLIAVMAVRFIAWLGIAAAAFFLSGAYPGQALLLIMLLLLLFSLAGGVGAVPFQEIFARLFPPTLRGRFLATRQLGGGILAILGGLAVKYILDIPWPFPSRYGLLFALSALTMTFGFIALASVAEEAQTPHKKEAEKLSRFLERLGEILKRDHGLRRLLTAELFLRTIHICLPFLVLDFRTRMDLDLGFVGTALMARMAGQLISNLWWGKLSDHLGNRSVILVVNCMSLLLAAGSVLVQSPAQALAIFFLAGSLLSVSACGAP